MNDEDASPGDWISDGVQMVEIEPQAVVIQFKRQFIRIPALYEWQG